MAKLTDIIRQQPSSRGTGRRRYTAVDMACIKHDAAVLNSRVNRGEAVRTQDQYLVECGCGAEGCFIHGAVPAGETQVDKVVD